MFVRSVLKDIPAIIVKCKRLNGINRLVCRL